MVCFTKVNSGIKELDLKLIEIKQVDSYRWLTNFTKKDDSKGRGGEGGQVGG